MPPAEDVRTARPDPVDWHTRFRQQARWTAALRTYLYRQTGLAKAGRVLEVGCGTGAILEELAAFDGPQVFGLDIMEERLAEARRHVPAARLVRGDALRLPHPSGSMDICLCHFLLLWLRDPAGALVEMRRVVRPGGHVLALAEPDHTRRIDLPETLAGLGRLQSEALRRQGASPDIGARLNSLFEQAGIRIVESGCLSEGKGWIPSEEEQAIEWAVLCADLKGQVPAAELDRLRAVDEKAWRSGERRLFVPTHYAWGRI